MFEGTFFFYIHKQNHKKIDEYFQFSHIFGREELEEEHRVSGFAIAYRDDGIKVVELCFVVFAISCSSSEFPTY